MTRPENEEQWLDRCVDGELSAAEQSALLRRLDETPEGWRKLALAFLEHQAWARGCMTAPLPPAIADAPAALLTEPAMLPAVPSVWNRWWPTIAVAGFLLGITLRPWLPLGAQSTSRPDRSRATLGSLFPGPPRESEPGPTHQLAASDTTAETTERLPRTVVKNLRVGVPTKDGLYEVSYPVLDATADPKEEPRELLPAPVIERLRTLGYAVEQQRHLYTTPLQDGRSLLVPVDTVHVRVDTQ